MDDKPFLHGSGPFSIATVCRLKTKNSLPILGRELAHAVPPGLCQNPEGFDISLGAANGADRFPYDVRVDLRSAPTIGGSAREWFSAGGPEQARIRSLALSVGWGPPTRPGHSVWAWWEYYMPLWRLVKRLEFTLIYPNQKMGQKISENL